MEPDATRIDGPNLRFVRHLHWARRVLAAKYLAVVPGLSFIFPVSLALYARVAPPAVSATIIGIYYLAFFAANNLVGWIGGFLEKMSKPLHAALAGFAGVIFLLAGRIFSHLLAPGDNETPAKPLVN